MSSRMVLGVLVALALTGCATVSLDLPYYFQSVTGHLAVMRQARPIGELLERDEVDARLRPKLEQAVAIRAFASRELAMPVNGSYTRYAELGRPFVVWNVFAAPELSLKLKRWCFPVAGCVSYRGYFDRAEAERFAAGLRAQGWEVQVAGVPAYSTLGWFDDPVLSSFIRYPEGELARLIFHELAHQVVYVKDDSTFNESFATAVEEAGVQRWLVHREDSRVDDEYRRFAERRRQFRELLRTHRAALQALYESDLPDGDKRRGKAEVFAALQADYRQLKQQWGGYAGYDRWFAQQPGNAHLAAVATYDALVPAFRKLLALQDGDMSRFFEAVRQLSREDRPDRERVLAELMPHDGGQPVAGSVPTVGGQRVSGAGQGDAGPRLAGVQPPAPADSTARRSSR
jgi:predicted aminopeptidase